MSLLELPNELIAIICDDADIIPCLRLTCRRLRDAADHSFIDAFFAHICVPAHPISMGMLLEIGNHDRLRVAVRSVTIDANGAFGHPWSADHLELIDYGIIRAQPLRLLPKLPNCHTLTVIADASRTRETPKVMLGVKLLGDKYYHKRRLEDEDGGILSSWLTEAGFAYSSYVVVDLLHAVSVSSNNITTLVLGEVESGTLWA